VIRSEDVPRLFDADGSWRDVWVMRTTDTDWDKFLSWIHTAFGATSVFTIDGESGEFPRTLSEILTIREHASPHFEFRVSDLPIQCRFSFAPDSLDLDFNPAHLDPRRLSALVHWIRSLGKLLSKDVLVAEESRPHSPILVFLECVDRVVTIKSVDREPHE
jgi:hypothetical protein